MMKKRLTEVNRFLQRTLATMYTIMVQRVMLLHELHNGRWYREQLRPCFSKKHFEPVPSRLIGGLICLSVIVVGIAIIASNDLPIWAKCIVAFVLGNAFASIGFFGHEVLHATVVRNPDCKISLAGSHCFLYARVRSSGKYGIM